MIELQGKRLYVAPDYFDRFACKCGACRNSCCEGWGISVSLEEYFRLIGMDCSPELHRRLESAFHTAPSPSPERYALISPNWLGRCPLHGEDGLCMLQKECGEEALPAVCRAFPRSLRAGARGGTWVCSAACEAVTELLMEEEGPLRFVLWQAEGDSPFPEEEQLFGLRMACILALQDRSTPLSSRVARVASLAADRPEAEARALPETEEGLFAVTELVGMLSEDSAALRRVGEDAMTRYRGEGALARYRRDRERFEAMFPDWERMFENLLVNHLFYAHLPFDPAGMEGSRQASGLAGVYALMRVVPVGYMAGREGLCALADALSGLFRLVDHTRVYKNAEIALRGAGLETEQGIRSLLGL